MTSTHAPGDPGQRMAAEPWRRWTRRDLATERRRTEGCGEEPEVSQTAVGWGQRLGWGGAGQAGRSCFHIWRVSVVKAEMLGFLNKQTTWHFSGSALHLGRA